MTLSCIRKYIMLASTEQRCQSDPSARAIMWCGVALVFLLVHYARATPDQTTEVAKVSTVSTNDCLGLGSYFAGMLESLLQKTAHGSSAQRARFFLTSRKMPQRNEVMIGEQFGLEWTDFEARRNTVVIVHGFLSNGHESWIHKMNEAFLRYGDVNVIAVDWSDGGDTWNYYKAVFNTQTTGSQIATLFDHIANYTLDHGGPSEERWGHVHCVGHSLGAHICGNAAYQMKERKSRSTIQRITGLDPAQPCFKAVDLSLRLDKSDAPFVDVIHTNGRFLSNLGLGLPEAIGHIDFYPNGGKMQPGCELTKFTIPILTAPKDVINHAICSHGRSYSYFTESINIAAEKNCTFWAQPWDRSYRDAERIMKTDCETSTMCTEMGINSENYNYRGTFFALTSSTQPYCNNGYWDVEEVKEILKSLDPDSED